mgnify:FL=1
MVMDSTDFALWGKRSTKRFNDNWSFKCNRPGRRYQVLMNLETRVIALWGGYSPKIYDGNWLESHKVWLEQELSGAVIIADCHYNWGVNHLNNITMLVPFEKKKTKKRKKSINNDQLPK